MNITKGCMRQSVLAFVLAVVASSGLLARALDATPPNSAEQMARPAQQVVESVSTPWLRKVQHQAVVYFLYATPAVVRRFDLDAGAWLADIHLDAVPKSIAVSNEGIFVNQNINVRRFDLSGTGGEIFPVAWTNADDIGIYNGFLISSRDRKLQSVRIADAVQVAVYESLGGYYTPRRFVVAADSGYLFGWQTQISPVDILRIPVSSNGSFGAHFASPYHGDFPGGTVVYASLDASVVIDELGIAFRGADLTYRSGTGGQLSDVFIQTDGAESEPGIFVLRGARLAWLTTEFREVGVMELAQSAQGISKHGDTVFLFRGGAVLGSIEVHQHQLLDFFRGRRPPPAPNPNQVPFVPDSADLSDTGILYLFNRNQRVVHRFSVDEWTYLRSAALGFEPRFASVNRAGDQVYVAYEGGRLGVLNPGSVAPMFLSFGPVTATGMGAADEFVMTVDSTGAWASHRIFNQMGQETHWLPWNRFSQEFSWSRATRRMFFFRDGTSPNDLHFEEISTQGTVVASGETPYHGTVQTVYPIRPTPNGARVTLGSGQVFDGINLTMLAPFPVSFKDLTWIGNDAVSMHAEPGGSTRLVRWSLNTPVAETILNGAPVRAFGYGSEVIAVTTQGGATLIHRW